MFVINIDVSGLDFLKDLDKDLEKAAKQTQSELTLMTYGKVLELANERLHSRRKMFIDGLSIIEEEGVSIINLDAKLAWIEDGMPPHSMLDDLLASPKAKTAADGSRYVVVPFKHGPGIGKGQATPAQTSLIDTLKAEMKRQNIPWAKIELGPNGQPKLGKIHSFDISHGPLKTHQGPGQGWGKIGDVKQGPSQRQLAGGPPGGGTPFLHGVSVYQKANANGKVEKSIMTFRVASSKHADQGRWQHPGLEKTQILADAAKWAESILSDQIAPRLMERINALITND